MILENSKLPKEVTISYKSYCKNGVNDTQEDGRKCSNISIGDEVTTNARAALKFHLISLVLSAFFLQYKVLFNNVTLHLFLFAG